MNVRTPIQEGLIVLVKPFLLWQSKGLFCIYDTITILHFIYVLSMLMINNYTEYVYIVVTRE